MISGITLDYVELLALGLTLLFCFVLAEIWVFLRPELEVSRDIVPARVAEGEGAAGVITVTNVGSRRCPSLIASEALGARQVNLTLAGLAPGASHNTSYLLPTDRRGVFPVGPLEISHADPLGLVGVGYGRGGQTSLIVHPRTIRVSPIPTGRSQDFDGPTKAGAPRGGIAFHSLRDYVVGDDLRLVHWPSTARTGQLMVRHTVVTNEPSLVLVLDTAAASYPDPSDFEHAVRVFASLVLAGVERQYPTQVHATSGLLGSIDPVGTGRTTVLDRLAELHLSDADPGLASLGGLSTRRLHGASLGVVTGLAPAEQLGKVVAVRRRFEMATVVQLGERLGRPGTTLEGVLSLACADLEHFGRLWKAKVGS